MSVSVRPIVLRNRPTFHKIPIMAFPPGAMTKELAQVLCACFDHVNSVVTAYSALNVTGVACSVVAALDPMFINYLLAQKPRAFVMLTPKQFLSFTDTVVTANTPALPIINYHCLRIGVMGISGKGYHSTTVSTTMEARFKAFCGTVGVPPVIVGWSSTTWNALGTGLASAGLVPHIMTYVLQHFALPPQEAEGGRAARPAPPREDAAAKTQVLLLCEFGGLQSLKNAQAFATTDNSSIWMLTEICNQKKRLDRAWASLLVIPNYQYARLLGYDLKEWEASNYTDILWCAGYRKSYHSSISGLVSWGKKDTFYDQEFLKVELAKEMEYDVRFQAEDPVVARVLAAKGLKLPEADRSQDAFLQLIAMMREDQAERAHRREEYR